MKSQFKSISDFDFNFKKWNRDQWPSAINVKRKLFSAIENEIRPLKGCYPLGEIFLAQWYFLLSFDAHSPPIGKKMSLRAENSSQWSESPLEWPSAVNVSQHPVVNCTAQILCRITSTKPEDFGRYPGINLTGYHPPPPGWLPGH